MTSRIMAAVVGAAASVTLAVAPADATPGVVVFPGMEVHQDTNVCTLGFVDAAMRIAFTAGHCRGSGAVTDRDGHIIGNLATYRDNTPDGSTVTTDQLIADYEAIVLVPDVDVNNVLPGGLALESDPGVVAQQGQPVCHFGIITGQSCGTIERVNNGWFTMANGVVSQKGDSGGPVFVIDGGRAVMLGLFNSTWGQFPAAVSWQATRDQVQEDVGVVRNTGGAG